MNRGADVVTSAVALALTAPVLGAAAAAIKLEDGRPVLYRQPRLGLNGEAFER